MTNALTIIALLVSGTLACWAFMEAAGDAPIGLSQPYALGED